MIERKFIETEVDVLIDDFQKSFKDSTLLENKREDIINVISECFEQKKVFNKYEKLIHTKILKVVNKNYKDFPDHQQDTEEDYVEYIMKKFGDEIGALLLLTNLAISKIAKAASEAFNEKIESAK
jgi:hypothetical protein